MGNFERYIADMATNIFHYDSLNWPFAPNTQRSTQVDQTCRIVLHPIENWMWHHYEKQQMPWNRSPTWSIRHTRSDFERLNISHCALYNLLKYAISTVEIWFHLWGCGPDSDTTEQYKSSYSTILLSRSMVYPALAVNRSYLPDRTWHSRSSRAASGVAKEVRPSESSKSSMRRDVEPNHNNPQNDPTLTTFSVALG